MILSTYTPTSEDFQNDEFLELNQEASDLYGLIHARFIITKTGLAKLYNKLVNSVYGYCPRALCDKQKVLPVGLSDELRTSRVKVFCPKCEEVYIPKFKSINVDGAYFGTSVPHIFQKTFKGAVVLPPKIHKYEPKIFGFKMAGKTGSKYAKETGRVRKPQYDKENKKVQQSQDSNDFNRKSNKQKKKRN